MRCSPTIVPNAKIVLVGEAPGKDEEFLGKPFVGASGQELTRILADAGIDRAQCTLTNVFMDRPPNNKLHKEFCAKKAEVGGKNYTLPPLKTGAYVKPEYLFELDRLKAELEEMKPNLVVALGGTAAWALLMNPKITQLRGTVAESTLVPGLKVLPTFHPASVLRQWDNRAVMVMDLMKAKFESSFSEIRRPRRELWIEPTLKDIEVFYHTFLAKAGKIDLDIETRCGQITCIGFAPSKDRAICIPFTDLRKASRSYWDTLEEELEAWSWVRRICALPCAKEGQNGLYDIQYLWRVMGIPTWNYFEDTMLMHHALYSELPKGLGFLASVYTNEASWKEMRKEGGDLKRDD